MVTNISADDVLKLGYNFGQTIHVTVGKQDFKLPFVRTFSDVPLNQPLLFIDSRGLFSLAVNQGSFADAYHITLPSQIVIQRKK
jgi:hypothetical protein